MNTFTQQAPPPIQPSSYSDRQFLHTTSAGVTVPLMQTGVTALMIGVFVFAMIAVPAIAFRWRHWFGWAFVLFLFATLGSMLVMWLGMLKRWMQLTKRDQLQVDVRSVDHDDNPATPKIIRVQLDHVQDNGHIHQTAIFDLPATEAQMTELAAGLLDEHQPRPCSEREWTGAGRPFSVNEFRVLRAELIRRKLLALKSEKDPRQGYVLTDDGKGVFEQFLR